MPNTVKKQININPRHLGLMEQRLQERENTVTPLENPDLEPIPIQSHYQVNPSYWGNTTVNGEPVDITGYRDSNTGIARYQDGEYGYVNLPDNYGKWMMDGVTIYPERPRLKGVVRNYFDDAQQSKILGQSNVIAPIGVGDSEIQPIQFPTKAPEKYHGQDLDRFFANLLTFGTAGTEEYASQLFKDKDYLKGSIHAGLPLLVKGGPSGNLLRSGFWGYNLYNDVDDAAKMIQDRNGWGYGKDVAKMVLDSGALLYDQIKFLSDAPPYLEDIARQRNNMGYWARTASDIIQHPLDTYRTIRKGTYVHDYPSLRRAVAESKQAVSEGADYTRNYYQNALKVDMPEANITAKTNIPGAWGEQIPGTTNFNYTFYRSPFSNLSRNTRDFKRVGGHEYTHLAEDYLNNRYFFPQLSVPTKPYYLPNVDHPIISTATVDDFMEGNIHGRSPEETWANYMGYNAGGKDPVMSFTDYNIEREGITPPRGFISDYEDYLKSLSGKALQKEGEIQLFNKHYGQKALGGTITDNSDSTILADNNNYIQDFKGRQYGLPTVRYANGGHLFGNGGDGRTTLPRVGDSWRNTETNESGTVVGYTPDVPYMGEDGKLYPTTSPVVKYDSGETLFGVTPQYTLPEVTATGHLRTPADDLDKVILGTLAVGVAPMALPEIVGGATAALANPYVDAALTSYFGAHGINDIANGNANAMTALEVLPMTRLAKPLWNAGKSAFNINDIRFSIGTPGKPYYWDPDSKQWASPEVGIKDAGAGKREYIDWVTDPKYIEAAEQNKKEAEAMGLKYIPWYERPNAREELDLQIALKPYADKNSNVGAYTRLGHKDNPIHYNMYSQMSLKDAFRHEYGHNQGFATTLWEDKLPFEQAKESYQKQKAYLRYKASQVFNKDYKYPVTGPGGDTIYSPIQWQPWEVAMNMRDTGVDLGIKVGEKYPGYEKALKIINEYEGPKKELKEGLNLTKELLPYVWKALNGTQFMQVVPYIGIGAAATGYGLYDNFNSTNSDIHAYGGPLIQQANMFGKGGTTTGPEVIITPDEVYNRFLNTLPDNQRLTPNEDYDTYLYWKLNGKPKNFQEALDRGMYTWDDSDNSYHGNSIAWGDDGTGYFIKPKHHDTLKYELDWFNKNIVTEEGGHQRFETPEERAESDRFRENYILADDPDRPNFYIYKPKDQAEGLNTYERQNDISIKEKALGGHLFDAGDTVVTNSQGYTGYTVNPMYWGNMKTTEGQPITNILGYLGNNQARVQYNDGTTGIVEYPQNFVQGIAPEVIVYGKSALNRYNTDKAIIDNAYQGKTYEEIAEAKERARQTMDEYAQEHTNEGLALYKDQLQNQAIQGLIEEANRDPAKDLEWGLGNALSLGTLSAEKQAVDDFNNGNYTGAILNAARPLMLGEGLAGNLARFTLGGIDLTRDFSGAYQDWNQRDYRNLVGRLPGIGLDALIFGTGAYGVTNDALNMAAQLGNTNAKAIQFARALGKDVKDVSLQDSPVSWVDNRVSYPYFYNGSQSSSAPLSARIGLRPRISKGVSDDFVAYSHFPEGHTLPTDVTIEEPVLPNRTFHLGYQEAFPQKVGYSGEIGDNIATQYSFDLQNNVYRYLHYAEPKVQELGEQFLKDGQLKPILDYYKQASVLEKQQLSDVIRMASFTNSKIPYTYMEDFNTFMNHPLVKPTFEKLSARGKEEVRNAMGVHISDNGRPGFTYIPKRYQKEAPPTVQHEGDHAVQYQFTRPPEMINSLRKGMPHSVYHRDKSMISGNELREPGSAALDVEKGAAATDCRTVIINDFFAKQHRIPTFYELCNKIKALPISELQKIAKRASAYSKEYAKNITDWEAFRNSLIWDYAQGGTIQ